MKDHIYNTLLDFGVLGEVEVEVFYDWYQGRPTLDRDEAPDTSGATVTAVYVCIDGTNIEISDKLNDNLLDDLAYECTEAYLG